MNSSFSKYSDEFTKSICELKSVRAAAVKLNSLLDEEGCKYKGKVPCVLGVAMDTLMAIDMKGSGNRPRSVDIAFGCEKNVMQLVECRYNYVNLLNLERKKLESKVSHSKELLQRQVKSYLEYTPCNITVLLFSDKLIAQARSHVRRLFPMTSSMKSVSFMAMTTKEFIKAFF